MPNHMKPIDGIIEVFCDEFYDALSWYNCILDLWGYIGESAVSLAQTNKKVIVYEPHPENYRYLLENIKPYNNIIAHNHAAVGNDDKTMIFYGWPFNMRAGNQVTKTTTPSTQVSCKNIVHILAEYDFDAMKMDIEWAEYECMDAIMESWTALFQKIKTGFIEFHFLKDIQRAEHAKRIMQRVVQQGYKVRYFDVLQGTRIDTVGSDNEIVLFLFSQYDEIHTLK